MYFVCIQVHVFCLETFSLQASCFFSLSDLRQVQVADYGLYKDLYNVDVYKKDTDKHRALVKWTAPEVLEAEDLSSVKIKSDVV